MSTIIISKDGGGDFSSVSEAVKNAAAHDTLYIKKGVYKERIEITKPLEIIGEDVSETVIVYGMYANMTADGERLGTFRSYTMLVNTDNFRCRNITVSNDAGFGADVGQAIAVYAEGDSISFENCRILGHQDTLFTGPLPFKEIEKGGFRGPTEFAERRTVHQRFLNCYIEGEVDFIFGSAAVYFENCELFSLNCGKKINGFVTAASTYEGQAYGYIFNKCRFTGNCPPKTVYLGRPWRDNAQTILIDCELGEHICDELFHDWNKTHAHETVFYAVYGFKGSTDKLPPFVKIIDRKHADSIMKKIKSFEV
ncbi:MAG: pectin methylesterase [Oscillospiraceae bacterium]|nr:pectin methylesterase [Oscillospiraceae bacterium]